MEWLASLHPRVNFAWRGEFPSGLVEGTRLLYDHELVVVSRGACRVEVDGTAYELTAGSFLIVPPAVPHRTVTLRTVHRSCLHFDWRVASAPPIPLHGLPGHFHPHLVRSAPADVPPPVVHGRIADPRGVAASVDRCFAAWSAEQLAERLTLGPALHDLLIRLLVGATERCPPPSRGLELAHAIKQTLDRILVDEVRLSDELAALGCSYEHACRTFRRYFRLAPLRYLHLARIERARLLLGEPGATVAGVAQAVGFTDPSYFARVYRRLTGQPPGAQRRR